MYSKKSNRKSRLKKKIFNFKLLRKSSGSYEKNKISKKKFCNKETFKIINILIFLLILIIINNNTSIKKENNIYKSINEVSFQINTTHKSKYNKYNYEENIIVKKDLFNDISYTPISKSNSIINSPQISNETYFELCQSKTLLDKTKYKRNKNPKISVIIPFYNKNKFSIFVPLRSIQNQSLKDLEIIIVDDGSSEEVLNQIIEEMKNDNRIILLQHKENKGTLMTRVDGVRYASGEYILNLDQDDLFIDNLFFENIFTKAKELNIDILQFSTLSYNNKNNINRIEIKMPVNKIITQPELKTAFLEKIGENRFSHCTTRMIWDKFVKREIYKKAIDDLGDEYLNHRILNCEDTVMSFELSQIAHSYYFYDIFGYRFNWYNAGKSRVDKKSFISMNQLHLIKLILYKFPPQYDRCNVYSEWGTKNFGSDVFHLKRSQIDLLQEVLEVIEYLEKKYNNTCKELLRHVSAIKKFFKLP